MQFISRVENNGRKQEIEEYRVLERNHVLYHHSWTHTDNQSDNHPLSQSELKIYGNRTSKYGYDGFMDSSDLS